MFMVTAPGSVSSTELAVLTQKHSSRKRKRRRTTNANRGVGFQSFEMSDAGYPRERERQSWDGVTGSCMLEGSLSSHLPGQCRRQAGGQRA